MGLPDSVSLDFLKIIRYKGHTNRNGNDNWRWKAGFDPDKRKTAEAVRYVVLPELKLER